MQVVGCTCFNRGWEEEEEEEEEEEVGEKVGVEGRTCDNAPAAAAATVE